jgi:hypothetical protein
VGLDVDVGVEREQTFARCPYLRMTDACAVEQHLSLQVRCIDTIAVDHAQGAYARCREIQRGRRSKPTRADDQHAR